jgi:pimeloyl-ACP methyl ester carboxylesterase
VKSVYLEQYGGFIRYLDFQGKEPVRLYLPGLASAAIMFLDTIQTNVLKNNRSILVDYFGSGFSDAPEDFEYSLNQYVEMAVAVLEKEKLEDVEVIGHSMGGTIAIQLARDHPDLVSKLVICEANIEPGGGPGTSQIVSMGHQYYESEGLPHWREETRRKAAKGDEMSTFLLTVWCHSTTEAIFRGSEMLVNLPSDFKERFFDLTIPKTFIYGDSNIPHPPNRSWPDAPYPEELRSHGVNIAIIPDSGHLMMIDNLSKFAESIAESLK